MKRVLHTIIVLVALLPLQGWATQYLVLTQQDGTVSKFALTETPVITFAGGDLVVTCGSQTLTTSMAGLKTHFEETATAVSETVLPERPTVAFGQAVFQGLHSGDRVTVYTLDGKTVATTRADGEGTATLRLSSLGHGVLIVRTPTRSYKIKN